MSTNKHTILMELDKEVRRSSHLYQPNPNVISMSQNELMNFESDARRSPFSGPTPDLMELERIAMRDFVREYGAVVHRAPKVVTKLYLSNLDETVTREHIQELDKEVRRSSHLYEPNPNVISMSQNELMNFESDARRSPFSGPTPDLMELERIAMRDFVREHGAHVHRLPKVVTKLFLSNLDETVTTEHIQELDEEVRRSSHLYEPTPNVISMSQNELMNFESDAWRSPFSEPTPDLMELERIAMRDFVREHGAHVHRLPKVVTKLFLSNLDETVTREHIQRLFSEAGELERCSVHYDQFGNSQGTAEVLFVVESDALAALGRWNNTMFCGEKLNIELVGTSLITHDPVEIHDLDHLPPDI